MKEFLLNLIEKTWLKKKSIPFALIFLAAVFLVLASMYDDWEWIVVPTWLYNTTAIILLCAWMAYSVACIVLDHLPKVPKGTLGVLFCIDAESVSLYEAARFKLAESFNEANPGGKVRVMAKCVSKMQVAKYDLQDKDSTIELLKKTNCVLFVRVRYSADNASDAEDFELKIGCGVRHPRFNEKASAVIVRDMSILTETVRNQHFSKENAISVFSFTTKTLIFACNYIMGFIYLLAKDAETAYTLLISARMAILQDNVVAEEQEKWRALVDDRIYSALAQITCDCIDGFEKKKNAIELQRAEKLLCLANKIYPDTYLYNVNMAYIQVTLHHNATCAKELIDKCKLSARGQPEKGWLFSDAFLAAYLGYAPGTIIARYNKAIREDKQSNLVELVEHIEFMISEQPEKMKLHLAAALVYEAISDFKLMKQHLAVFLNHVDVIDGRSRKLLTDKIDIKDCNEECNHNCERCAS